MQIYCVRHDGRANDTNRKKERFAVCDLGSHRVNRRSTPIDRCDEDFCQVAKCNHHHQAADNQLDGTESAAFKHQDAVGDDRRDHHSRHQWHLEQQCQTDRAAEKFGKICGHGSDFAHDPHRVRHRARKLLAAHFRQIAARNNAEFRRQRLEHHRDQIGEQHDPEQTVTVFGAGLDIGCEVSGIHVGDRRDHRWTGKGEIVSDAAMLSGQYSSPDR